MSHALPNRTLGRDVLSLSVRDDGVGGADPDGSGLTGLRERPRRSAALQR